MIFQPTHVSAYGDRVVWSRAVPGPSPIAGWQYELLTWHAGAVNVVAVPPRDVPFDVDLGRDDRGHTVAVYSRCSDEPKRPGVAAFPDWSSGTGCDIYRHDFDDPGANHRFGQTKLKVASAPQLSEFLPTIWDKRIAYARVPDSRRAVPRIYVRRLDGTGKPRRLPAGSGSVSTHAGPTGLDLGPRRLAIGWSPNGASAQELLVDTLGGKRTRIARDLGTDETTLHRFTDPQITDNTVFYGDFAAGESGVVLRYRSYNAITRARAKAEPALSLLPFGIAFDGGRAWYSANPDAIDYRCTRVDDQQDPTTITRGCVVARSDVLSFQPVSGSAARR